MNGDTNTSQTSNRNTLRRFHILLGVGVVILILPWLGCSVEKHYELLNKFFDGVPDPNAVGPQDRLAMSQSPTFSEHKPFVDENCYECHTDPSDMMLAKNDSSMCMSCHDDINEQFPMMHGAVTGNACLMCHNPHLSALAHLLREEAPGLCLQCHDMAVENPTAPHEDIERNCLSCHHGHGGDVPFFLLDQKTPELSDTQSQQPGKIDGP